MDFNGKIKLGLNKIDYNMELGVSNDNNTLSNRLYLGGNSNDQKNITDYGVVLKGKLSDIDLKLNFINNDDNFKLIAESKYNFTENCKLGLKYENEINETKKDNQLSFLLDAKYNLDGTVIGMNTEQVIYGEHVSENLNAEKFGYLINPYIKTCLIDETNTSIGLVYKKKELINEFGYHEIEYDKYLELGLDNNKN